MLQRLVADVLSRIACDIDPVWPREAPTVAARQDRRTRTDRVEMRCEQSCQRRLAGPTGREIADADHRQARVV
jgi:hypothetical protein